MRQGEIVSRLGRNGVGRSTTITSHRLYVMGHDRILFEGTPDDLRANAAARKTGVARGLTAGDRTWTRFRPDRYDGRLHR